MKCPSCNITDLIPAKMPGYYSCPNCGFLFVEKVNDDPDLTKYTYKVDMFRTKKATPPEVFEVAKNKFDNGTYEVIACKLDRGNYSLLFGQQFFVLKRKLK